MNQHYHSPTSTFGFPDLDQVFHGNGLESAEEKAVAARRKNAEAQKMYRIRKKEHEQSLEREVNRLRQRLQEREGDLERTNQDLERTNRDLERLRHELEQLKLEYTHSGFVPISTSPWQAQGAVYHAWEDGGYGPSPLGGRPSVHVLSDSQRYREYGNPVPSLDMLGSRKSPKGVNLNSSPDPSEKCDEERKDEHVPQEENDDAQLESLSSTLKSLNIETKSFSRK